MSTHTAGGPALFLGTDTDYVALVRPALDPDDEGVRRAAEEAGVSPEEFAGSGDTWAVLYAQDGEGDGFELPGVRDAEPADVAQQLRAGLTADAGAFTVDGGSVLRLDVRPAGADAHALTAYVTPPDDADTRVTVETGPLPAAALLTDLGVFLESLAP